MLFEYLFNVFEQVFSGLRSKLSTEMLQWVVFRRSKGRVQQIVVCFDRVLVVTAVRGIGI